MRVRVTYTVDVTDDYRRGINLYLGNPGLATRAAVKRWLEGHGSMMDADLYELVAAEEEEDTLDWLAEEEDNR
jgi:hypothetical protein